MKTISCDSHFLTDPMHCSLVKIPLCSFRWEEVETWSRMESPRVLQLYGAVREGPNVILFMDLKRGDHFHQWKPLKIKSSHIWANQSSLSRFISSVAESKGSSVWRTGSVLSFSGAAGSQTPAQQTRRTPWCERFVAQSLLWIFSTRIPWHHSCVDFMYVVDNVLLSEDGRQCFLCDFGLSETLNRGGYSIKTFRGDYTDTHTLSSMHPCLLIKNDRCSVCGVCREHSAWHWVSYASRGGEGRPSLC